jgi:hypothetical protein
MVKDARPHSPAARRRTVLATLAVAAAASLSLVAPRPALAATLTVTSCADSGPGTLRADLASANPGDVIVLPACTISTLSTLDVTTSVTIMGPGAVRGNGTSSVFNVAVTGPVTMSQIYISGGGGPEGGGGIYNARSTPLTVTDSDIEYNNANSDPGLGGGIANWSSLDVNDSTIANNTAFAQGGGVWNARTATITNSTIADNTGGGGGGVAGAGGSTRSQTTLDSDTVADNTSTSSPGAGKPWGGGIWTFEGAQISLQSTIVAGNTPANCGGAAIADVGYNLDSDGSCALTAASSLPHATALLGSLADNGGPLTGSGAPPPTIALLSGSPAYHDITNAAFCPPTDERLVIRGVPCSIGAYEGTKPLVINQYDLCTPACQLYIGPSPVNNEMTYVDTLGYLQPNPGQGLISLYSCQLGGSATVGNFASADQSGTCEAAAHPGLSDTVLGVLGYIYASPPAGIATVGLYRCVDNAVSPPSYLETTSPPTVGASGAPQCGQDPASFTPNGLLGYVSDTS